MTDRQASVSGTVYIIYIITHNKINASSIVMHTRYATCQSSLWKFKATFWCCVPVNSETQCLSDTAATIRNIKEQQGFIPQIM